MPHWEAMALKVRGQLHMARGDDESVRKATSPTSIDLFVVRASRPHDPTAVEEVRARRPHHNPL